jgi:upstream activation factor subunit UAF30
MPSSKNSGSKAKKGAKKSTPKKQVSAPAPEPVVVAPEPVSVTPTVTASDVESISLDEQFKDILTRLQEFRTLSNTLMADVRKLQKNVAKQVRESNKKNRKRKVRSGDSKRPPSGFAKPALISDALCQFLGVSKGSEMARTEVTKYLTKYIKEHKLQDEKNKRIIVCDSKLTALLKVQPNDEVTYFNLQRYMKPHFPKSASASSSSK